MSRCCTYRTRLESGRWETCARFWWLWRQLLKVGLKLTFIEKKMLVWQVRCVWFLQVWGTIGEAALTRLDSRPQAEATSMRIHLLLHWPVCLPALANTPPTHGIALPSQATPHWQMLLHLHCLGLTRPLNTPPVSSPTMTLLSSHQSTGSPYCLVPQSCTKQTFS